MLWATFIGAECSCLSLGDRAPTCSGTKVDARGTVVDAKASFFTWEKSESDRSLIFR